MTWSSDVCSSDLLEDVVLILGKGHEVGQEIKGVIHPFDDRDIARSILNRKWGNNDPIE